MDESKYRAIPELSPYTKGDRYELLKEDHKNFIEILKCKIETEKVYDFVDIGCGNGEMLYQFSKVFPHWNYSGYDYTKEFIETAKNFPGLKEVSFQQSDMFEVNSKHDIVFCSSVFQIFEDPEKPLLKLLDLCNDNGFVFVDGLFNKFDIEVKLEYCDNSNEISKGLWRRDWNQHSQTKIQSILNNKVSSFEFLDVPMNLDMECNIKMPINRFTFRDQFGNNIITNGTNLMMNRVLLIIKI